jgi:hypothetical protein
MENLMSYPDLKELLEKLKSKLPGSISYRGENLIRILDLCAEMVTNADYRRQNEIHAEIYEILS